MRLDGGRAGANHGGMERSGTLRWTLVRVAVALATVATAAPGVAGRDRDAPAPPPPPAVHVVVPSDDLVLVARDRGVDVHAREGFADIDPPEPVGRIGLRGTVYDALWWSSTEAVLAVGSDGVVFLDLADPADPTPVARVQTTGSARRLARHGDVLYVADEQGGIVVVDARRTDRARIRRTVSTRGAVRSVDVLGDRLVAAEGSAGARLFDLERPDRPREVARLGRRDPAADAVFLDPGTVLVADGTEGVRGYALDADGDVTTIPGALRESGRIVALSRGEGGAVYASGGAAGIRVAVLDRDGGGISVEGPPILLPRSFPAGRVAPLDGGVVAIAAGVGGVAIVDRSDPETPRVIRPSERGFEVRWGE